MLNTLTSNSFIPRTSILWNSLPEECFPSGYNLNSFKLLVNRFLTISNDENDFLENEEKINKENDAHTILKDLRLKNCNKIILGHLRYVSGL